jgi:Ca2+-binding RTX toxin-like protein
MNVLRYYSAEHVIHRINGTDGSDYFPGTPGNDIFNGLGGDDTIYGSGGNDTLNGGADNDYITGDDGEDRLYGGGGKDTVYGGNDNDRIDGGKGVDLLYGDEGRDNISGGEGKDRLDGGSGKDILSGGADADADTFVFKPGNQQDVVDDFVTATAAHDIVDLTAFSGISGFADLKNHYMSQDGQSVVIQIDDDVLTLSYTKMDRLHARDFLFA